MRTFSLLKELPVIEKTSGEKIGEVHDLSITSDGVVTGLLIRKGMLFKKTSLIPIQEVSSFGPDGVMVEDESSIQQMDEQPEYTFEGHQRLTGRQLMTSEGEKLGFLEDVYFHEELGTIVGYKCSDGFFTDITEGKRVIKTDEPPTVGKDAIIIEIKES